MGLGGQKDLFLQSVGLRVVLQCATMRSSGGGTGPVHILKLLSGTRLRVSCGSSPICSSPRNPKLHARVEKGCLLRRSLMPFRYSLAFVPNPQPQLEAALRLLARDRTRPQTSLPRIPPDGLRRSRQRTIEGLPRQSPPACHPLALLRPRSTAEFPANVLPRLSRVHEHVLQARSLATARLATAPVERSRRAWRAALLFLTWC
jgi:hypothetical protein